MTAKKYSPIFSATIDGGIMLLLSSQLLKYVLKTSTSFLEECFIFAKFLIASGYSGFVDRVANFSFFDLCLFFLLPIAQLIAISVAGASLIHFAKKLGRGLYS